MRSCRGSHIVGRSVVNDIETSLKIVQEKIVRTCIRSGRSENDVKLIGVTKGVDIKKIQHAVSLGLKDFGENYVQEARGKIEGFNDKKVTWHMIGYIQTNKIKYIPKLFECVHSIDRWELLEKLDTYGKTMKVLFELNLSGETSKHGTETDNLKRMLEKTRSLQHIQPAGLMTMPPLTMVPEESRVIFRRLKDILHMVNKEFSLDMRELSMGMSSDFEVAIEEGATMVRVGGAIFGERT